MESPQYLRYFMRLTLSGIPDEALPLYELDEKQYSELIEYTSKLFSNREKNLPPFEYPDFFWTETVDGINLVFSEDDLDLLRFFTTLSDTPPPQPPKIDYEDSFYEDEEDTIEDDVYDPTGKRGQVQIYLRGRPEPLTSFILDEPELTGTIVLLMSDPNLLDPKTDGEFMYFVDENGGEGVAFRPEQVVLLVAHPGSIRFEDMEEEL